jgi:NAD(P)-dependent dehydrogenase (short-subunit alcohol dehydrogenase family)
VITNVCDISKRKNIEQMVAAGIDALGGLDVLVNNAGISGPTKPVEEIDPDEWEKVMQVNLSGTFNVTRLAIPHLEKSPAGSIIIMSSLGGRYGYPNRSPYATSKWGLIGFTKDASPSNWRIQHPCERDFARRGGYGPRIERVLRGRADAVHIAIEEEKAEARSIQSLKRFVDPKDIAALALFLASDAGKSISGQMLPIDNDSLKAA